METKYYDNWEFKKHIAALYENPFESKNKLEEYLRKYPNDYSAYAYYAYNLIVLGEFDKAEKVLNNIEKMVAGNARFSKNSADVKMTKQDLLFDRLKLLAYQGRYQELYDLYLKNSKDVNDLDIKTLIFYCKSKLGKLNGVKKDGKSYLYGQILGYSEKEFLKHIESHLADYNSKLDTPNSNVFVPDFPISEVLKEVKKYIPSDKGVHMGLLDDTYIFKYNECGRENNKMVDYFKVVCFHNTKNMITICPVSGGEHFPHVDLNYMVKDDNKEVKKISQIEKFNNRFRRK